MPLESFRIPVRLGESSRVAAVAAATFALDLACLWLSRPQGGVAAIWPSDGLALGLMLASRSGASGVILAASFLGAAASDLAWGDTPLNAVCLAGANIIGVLLAYKALQATVGQADLKRARHLLLLLVFSGVAAAVSAALASAWLGFTAGGDATAIFRDWLLADMLGYVIVAPLIHALLVRSPAPGAIRWRREATALGGFCVLALGVFGQRQYPLLFFVPLGLFVVAYLTELRGAAVAVMLTAVIAVTANALGRGPISLIAGGVGGRLLMLQVFLASLTFAILPISAALAERRELAISVAQARETAEAAARERSAMLADLSHELRTPLASVLGFASLLRETPELSPEARRLAEGVTIAGEGLLAAIENVLTFSTLQNAPTPRPSVTSPVALVEDALLLFRAKAEAKGLALEATARDAVPGTALLDAGRIRQVLLNLVGNAVNYTDAGVIRIVLSAACDELLFEIFDTGPGLAPDQTDALFQRFSRLDPGEARPPGAGLGLSITKALVEGMGGRIGVRSDPGVGSCFWFTAPMKATPALAGAPQTVRPQALIADDAAISRELMRRGLEPLGFEVTEANDGEGAAATAVLQSFELVVLDIQMPGLDGFAAAEHIRGGASASCDAMILAVSGLPLTEALSARLRSAGFDGFLPKPFTRAGLAQLVADRWPVRTEGAVEAA